ncbi:MAG TPA: aminopeptidase [Thermoflexia bacterium]|jgi:aminopeptidase|nr:aminopeptidase [Thermoflexia bacterium]
MGDPRVERLAAVLVRYSTHIEPGDLVLIRGMPAAEPLLLAVYEEVLKAGGHPHLQVGLSGVEEAFFRLASDEQLEFISPLQKMIIEEFDALISVRSHTNTRELSGIDPARQRRHNKAMAPLMKTYMQRGATGELKWVGTLYPTPAYAQEADMSLRDYEDFVYRACFCDQEDPVARWQEVHDMQQRLVEWLRGKKEVKIKGPNADLTLSIEGRVFINSDGHHNMPSGEIFTGPVEDSAEGWVRFTYPAITGGREVEGIELWFEKGRVVKATAEKNEEYLLQMLDTDPGARYLGEFAIGTNNGIQRFTKNILFDEKIGGSFHLAVGAGYPETGSKNESAIHWDMICDMRDGGEIYVDGELFYRSGEFMI